MAFRQIIWHLVTSGDLIIDQSEKMIEILYELNKSNRTPFFCIFIFVVVFFIYKVWSFCTPHPFRLPPYHLCPRAKVVGASPGSGFRDVER